MKIEEFLLEWFGLEGRELGKPERFYTRDPKDLLMLIEHGKRHLHPVYMSAQPFSGPDQPCAIERLYFDFDCEPDPGLAWKDASTFVEALKKYYGVEPLIVFSGRKGYHVHLFLEKNVSIEGVNIEFAKQVYEELQQRLLKGLKLSTLDPQPIGDIKRLARVPFSTHEKTSSLCVPVDQNKKPFVPESLDTYRTLNPELLSPIIKDLKTREKTASLKPCNKTKFSKDIRPCIKAALEKPLEGEGGHQMRLAIACEFLNKGYGVDEVVQLFQSQPDFKPERSHYYVEDAKKRGYKPFKCKTIRELGFCLPNCVRRKRKL